MFYKIRYKFFQVLSAIISSVSYRLDGFMDHYNGPKYRAVLYEHDRFLRNQLKHTDNLGSYREARDNLWEELKEWGVTIWE